MKNSEKNEEAQKMSEEKKGKDENGQGELFHGMFPPPKETREESAAGKERTDAGFYGESQFGKKLGESIAG